MIEKIDTVNWSSLKHAYGSASDVPQQIKDLASVDETIRKQALKALYSNIFHQGGRFEAAAYAIPYLGALLQQDGGVAKDEVIYLLVNLAIGFDDTYLPNGINPTEFRQNLIQAEKNLSVNELAFCKKYGTGPDVELACYNTGQQEVSRFITCLSDEDSDVRRAASYALAWFPDEAETIVPNLRHLLANESELVNIATVIISLGLLAHNSSVEIDLDFLSGYLSHNSNSIQTSASISLVTNNSQPGKDVLDILINSLVSDKLLDDFDRYIPFNEGNFRGLISLVLACCGSSQEIVIPALCQALKRVDSYHSLNITRAILQMVIDKDACLLKDQDPNHLTPMQIQALQTIAEHGGWKWGDGEFVDYHNLVRSYGLPDKQEKLCAYLDRVNTDHKLYSDTVTRTQTDAVVRAVVLQGVTPVPGDSEVKNKGKTTTLNTVSVYPMKKFPQLVNQILGLWSWFMEIITIIEFPLGLFISKWQRKVIPAFRKMMLREKRSFLEVSENGLKYRLWPWWEITCRWEDVRRINRGRWLGDALVLERADQIGMGEFSINLGSPQIHLSSLKGWKTGKLEEDLRRYHPKLFES